MLTFNFNDFMWHVAIEARNISFEQSTTKAIVFLFLILKFLSFFDSVTQPYPFLENNVVIAAEY